MFKRSMIFPADTVLVKTLSLEMTHGNPSSARRIETQTLHYDGRDWRGYTYEWNDEQTDATLVSAEGKRRNLMVIDSDGAGWPAETTVGLCRPQQMHAVPQCLERVPTGLPNSTSSTATTISVQVRSAR